jgi:hypothetical protein
LNIFRAIRNFARAALALALALCHALLARWNACRAWSNSVNQSIDHIKDFPGYGVDENDLVVDDCVAIRRRHSKLAWNCVKGGTFLGQYRAYRGWFTKPVGGSVLPHDIIAKTWTLVSS